MFDWLGDFLKLYFARTIFRANSSFSWWAATLSPTAKVFSPVIGQSHIYGVDGMNEITVDLVEGKEMLNVHTTSGSDAGNRSSARACAPTLARTVKKLKDKIAGYDSAVVPVSQAQFFLTTPAR